MTRVIAGSAGGRRLSVPAGRDTRPTSDRAREGLFSTVQAIRGPLAGASVLDLYAGSGAVGLEALSRGAARAVLVEADPRAVTVIRANIAALGLPGASVAADRVERVLARGPQTRSAGEAATSAQRPGQASAGEAAATSAQRPGQAQAAGRVESAAGGAGPAGPGFDVVFADPPYAVSDDAVTDVLAALAANGWLAPGALLAVERSTRSQPLRWPAGYAHDRSRRYGEATLWYGLATGAELA